MVSPYLLKPLRALDEVLSVAAALSPAREPVLRPFSPGRVSGTAAAILRQQGRTFRPRVVWVNDAELPESLPGEKPRKKD